MKDNLKKTEPTQQEISRKEALIKAGKYAAFTALGMMVILSPKKSQAESTNPEGLRGRGF